MATLLLAISTIISACNPARPASSLASQKNCKALLSSHETATTFSLTDVRVTPASSWCSQVNGATAGTRILFAPGNYSQACTITAANGTSANPIILEAESDVNRPVFNYSGASANMLDVTQASYLTIRKLIFRDSQANIDGIKIRRGDHITLEENLFENIGGISVSANSQNTSFITIRKNTLRNLRATGMYFGCHDGVACRSTDLLIEQNLISGVTSSAVGYGFEVKLNSSGVFQDNVILNTKGPGLMVYGSNLTSPLTNLIQRNLIRGSLNDAGINVGGGPARVINNIVFQNRLAGIFAQDYSGRGLQRNIQILHNTTFANTESEIRVQNWLAGKENIVAYNAFAPKPGVPVFSPTNPTGDLHHNVTCTSESECFRSPLVGALLDASPRVGGPLENVQATATYFAQSFAATDDYLGNSRSSRIDAGALVGGTARPLDTTVQKGPVATLPPGPSPLPSSTPTPSPSPISQPSPILSPGPSSPPPPLGC